MKPARQRCRHAHQARRRGSATVEFALCTVLIFMLLPPMLVFSRSFLFYNLLLRATRDAAHLVAAAPPGEMGNVAGRDQVLGAARALVLDAVAVTSGTLAADKHISVMCDDVSCDSSTGKPATVRVAFQLPLTNDVLAGFLDDFNDGFGYTLKLDVTVPYAY